MAKFVVTGGAGFIGSHLSDALLARGHEVAVLDDLSTGHRQNLAEGVRLRVGDAADPKAVSEILEGADGCFHLAAIASVQRSVNEWRATHQANQTATVTVLDAARQRRIPVVYASSAAVYGDARQMPIAEDDPKAPLTAYGADKLGSELHASVAWNVHQVPSVGLRFFNVYGPRQDPSSPYSGVISIFADRLVKGLPITIFGDGQQVRDFVFVGDVVAHLMAAMERCESGARVFNVCTGVPTSIRDLAKRMSDVLGVNPVILEMDERPGDIRASVGDPYRARRDLSVSAKARLIDGLCSLFDNQVSRGKAA